METKTRHAYQGARLSEGSRKELMISCPLATQKSRICCHTGGDDSGSGKNLEEWRRSIHRYEDLPGGWISPRIFQRGLVAWRHLSSSGSKENGGGTYPTMHTERGRFQGSQKSTPRFTARRRGVAREHGLKEPPEETGRKVDKVNPISKK